jgi:hypothetical protein
MKLVQNAESARPVKTSASTSGTPRKPGPKKSGSRDLSSEKGETEGPPIDGQTAGLRLYTPWQALSATFLTRNSVSKMSIRVSTHGRLLTSHLICRHVHIN